MKIGFLGLGTMGRGMAANLVKGGHQVTVWNRSPGPADALAKLGAHVATHPSETVGGDIVISIFADDSAVLSVFDDALLAEAAKGLIHVNMATVSVDAVKAMAAQHRRHGIGYVSAPVFGRGDAAAAGRLTIIAAGEDSALSKIQPALDCMGQKTWTVGNDPTQANIVKIAGNLMIATVIELLGEVFALVEKGGVPPKLFTEIVTSSMFAAPIFKGYADIINDKRFEPAGFKLRLGLKDVSLALAAGSTTATPLPLASVIRDHFLEGVAHGDGDKDWAALAAVIGRKAGLG